MDLLIAMALGLICGIVFLGLSLLVLHGLTKGGGMENSKPDTKDGNDGL